MIHMKMVQGMVGEKGKAYVPYLTTVMLYIGVSNIIGNICLRNLLLKAELRDSSSSEEFRGRSEAFTS